MSMNWFCKCCTSSNQPSFKVEEHPMRFFKRGVVLGREKGNFAVFGRKYWGMPGINIGLESHLGKTKTQVGVVKVIIDRFWWRGAGFKNEGRKFLGRRRQGFSQRWKGGMPAGFGGLGGWGVGGCQPCAPVVFQHASPIGNPSYLWPWVTTSWILESLGSLIKECRFIPWYFFAMTIFFMSILIHIDCNEPRKEK